jgi:ribosome maturation factor RimP
MVRVGREVHSYFVQNPPSGRTTREDTGFPGSVHTVRCRRRGMSRKENIEKRAEELLMSVLEPPYEFVDLEYVKEAGTWYLRAYCDKEGGITVDDCELISRAFEEKLDAADLISDAYVLEVSSPGLGRPLKKERDYRRALGQRVEVHTYRIIDHEKSFTGVLTDYDDSTVTLDLDDDGGKKSFAREDISLIRMAFDF